MSIEDFYNELDNCFSKNDDEKAREVLDRYYQYALDNPDCVLLCGILNERMGFFRSIGDEEPALESVSRMKTLIDEYNLSEVPEIETAWINMGTTLSRFGQYDEALSFYEKASKRLEGKDSPYVKASLSNNIGSVYEARQMYDEAISSYNNALKFLDSPGILSYYRAVTYANMCNCYVLMKDDLGRDSSLKNMDEILDKLDGIMDIGLASTLGKCATLHHNLGNEERAEELIRRALNIYNSGN